MTSRKTKFKCPSRFLETSYTTGCWLATSFWPAWLQYLTQTRGNKSAIKKRESWFRNCYANLGHTFTRSLGYFIVSWLGLLRSSTPRPSRIAITLSSNRGSLLRPISQNDTGTWQLQKAASQLCNGFLTLSRLTQIPLTDFRELHWRYHIPSDFQSHTGLLSAAIRHSLNSRVVVG